MPRSARSFADDIRARSVPDLAALLQARPDCARPEPSDLSALAARAQTRASVQRALEGLNAHELRLLEAVIVVGPDAAPDVLGATKKAVSQGLLHLWSMALLWRSPNGYTPVRAATEALANPAHLGPRVDEVPTYSPTPGVRAGEPARRLARTLENSESLSAAAKLAETTTSTLSDGARSVLEQLRWTNARASFASPKLTRVKNELIEAGLVVPISPSEAVIPREIGLALRGGRLYNSPWERAEVNPAHLAPDEVDAGSASVINDLLWRLDDVADYLDAFEPRVLRNGGLSVRDHRKMAAALDASLEFTAFLLELGFAADLWAPDGELDPAWRPTQRYDEWTLLPTPQRWAHVTLAWRDTARAPSLAGQTIDNTLINVLGKDASWPLLRARRRDVLTVLRDLEPGLAPSLSDVEALLRWQRPLRLPEGAPTRADVVLTEAEWLGLTYRNALSAAGRSLLDVPSADESDAESSGEFAEVVARLEQALPRPAPGVMLQADLTAIAPGPLNSDAAHLMRGLADVESRGGATVFRFSSGSVRRYLDAGHSATETLNALKAIAITPMPQPLEYLIADVARRHGQLRVGSVGSYLRSSDPSELQPLLADPALAHLGLRPLSDTVIASGLPAATVLDALRTAGLSPVAETSDGGVVVRAGTAARSPSQRRRPAPLAISRLDEEAARRLATTLREQPAPAAAGSASGPRIPSSDPTLTLTMLDDAAAEQVPVWIGYVDAGGDIKRTLFRPERIEGGRVVGQVGDPKRTGEESVRSKSFSIHRITGVAPA